MTLFRRLAMAVSLILVGLLAFAVTTAAFEARGLPSTPVLGKSGGGGGGNGLPAAGNYQNSSVSAGWFLCCGTEESLNVSHNKSVSNPLVGPTTSTDEIDVSFFVNDFTNGVFVSGCIIPDRASDFTVNSSLTAATLNTTVQPTTRTCQGQSISGVTPPFTLSSTWAMSGPTGSFSRVDRYSCLRYRSEAQTSSAGSSNAIASFSASFLPAPISSIGGASIFSFSQFTHAQGTPADSCIGLGGKGAGPGPQGAGTYTRSSMSASMQVQPDDSTQQPFGIFVSTVTNTAHPVGGPISTQTETDLNLSQFSPFNFIEECFVIPAGDLMVASDLHRATLNVSVDATTPACQFANNTGPNVFTINATWNATGPLANFSNTSQGGCGTFHVAGTQQGSGTTATATGSWPGTAAAFTDTNAFLSTDSTTSHVQGSFAGC